MPHNKHFLSVFAVVLTLSILSPKVSFSHKGHTIGKSEHPAIIARHKLMDDSVFAAKQAGQMVKGIVAYDAGKAELAMRLVSAAAFNMENYFPKASIPQKGSKSESSPKIWENMEDFLNEIKKFKTSSTTAIKGAEQGKEAFSGDFLKVMQSCKSCHEKYRLKQK